MFFGPEPQEIHKLTPHQKSKILCALRIFAKYYLRLTGRQDVKTAVRDIIERYSLNEGLDMDHHILIVPDGFMKQKLATIFKEIPDNTDIGFIIRFGLFTGIKEDEIIYCYEQKICDRPLCKCSFLHVFKLENRLTMVLINWIRVQKRDSGLFSCRYFHQWRKEYRQWSINECKSAEMTSTEINTSINYSKEQEGFTDSNFYVSSL
jgi:hypothetical protein